MLKIWISNIIPGPVLWGKKSGTPKFTASPQFIPGGAESAPTRLLLALLWASPGLSLPRERPGCWRPPAQMPLQLFQLPPTPAGCLSSPFNFLNCFQKVFSVQELSAQGDLGKADPTWGELRAGGLPSHAGRAAAEQERLGRAEEYHQATRSWLGLEG